jgi:hypothetical protein
MENGTLQRNRLKHERSVIVQLQKRKNLKTPKPIPEQLIKILLTENIKISDVLQLKEMLNEWIKILTEDNKNLE